MSSSLTRATMDDKTYLGSLGEAKVIAKLTQERYHVFTQVSGKAPFDLVAYKDGILYRVSVKSVTKKNESGVYTVQLKIVRPNRTGNKITNFDNTSCDILAVYLFEDDEVMLIDSKTIEVKSALTIRKGPVDRGTQS